MNREPEAVLSLGPRVVAIGGGTGLSNMLRGLKLFTGNLTAVVTVADDGGGSGILRDDMGILPPGDVRNCILALANTEPLLEKLLTHRFAEGMLAGQNFGNLFLAAMIGISDGFEEAVRRMGDVLAITGRVLPVSEDNVRLKACFEDGSSVTGESKVHAATKLKGCRIERVELIPNGATALPEAVEAIKRADILLLGPGSLYTSVIPNLLAKGITEAIEECKGLKAYICNVMTQQGETEYYSAFDHVEAIFENSRPGIFDYCLANDSEISKYVARKYSAEGAGPVLLDKERFQRANIKLVTADMLDSTNDLARHDHLALTKEIFSIFLTERPERVLTLHPAYQNFLKKKTDENR